jgi:hypothetical protein
MSSPGRGRSGRCLSSATFATTIPACRAEATTKPVPEARKLAALSLKTFFGPDKPYIRERRWSGPAHSLYRSTVASFVRAAAGASIL